MFLACAKSELYKLVQKAITHGSKGAREQGFES